MAKKSKKNRISAPAVALRALTILPGMVIHFDLSREKSIHAIEQAMMEQQKVFLVTQRDPGEVNPLFEDVYHVGCIAFIKQIIKMGNQAIRVLVEAESAAKLIEFNKEMDTYLLAEIEVIDQIKELGAVNHDEQEAMLRTIKELYEEFQLYYRKSGNAAIEQILDIDQLEQLLIQVSISLPFHYVKKQEILEAKSIFEKYEIIAQVLEEEIRVAKVKNDLAEKIKGRVEKNQKEYVLREQLNYIRQELGEDDSGSESELFESAIKKLKASSSVKEKIAKEISKYKKMGSSSSESAVERAYIETLLELPWDKVSKDSNDIYKAKEILEEDHYGLDFVKERIMEFLAVRILTHKGESPILCLVGPPGTGKTSIAKSVARALNKKYVRISLGGIHDEAEIRGHRKTYVGAMPGRIAMALKQAGVKNPLILLDEIDKISKDYKGDTSAALLEVLDLEQNSQFRDHYIELPMDLSQVVFIATANQLSDIKGPLRDRMEIIEVSGYTANEKLHIAKEHLLIKQYERNGLTQKQLKISENAVEKIIREYTKEAGVRELERKIGDICRKAAREIVEKNKTQIRVTDANLKQYLGKEKYSYLIVNEEAQIGIVRGLAWTSVGGDTLQIEVNVMPGKGALELTGQLGDVMKESAKAGISYIRSSCCGIEEQKDYFQNHDFHIHIPEGGVPKDGPSAGITMATALMSAITGKKIRADVAMTGEITLRGRVLPIGGLKEKLLAAKTAGIKIVIIPKKNMKDLEEISKEIKGGLDIRCVETMEEVLDIALVKETRK